jgi:hypothetical protein
MFICKNSVGEACWEDLSPIVLYRTVIIGYFGCRYVGPCSVIYGLFSTHELMFMFIH